MVGLRLRYRLRTIIIAITAIAVVLALWGHSIRCKRLAALHHFAALASGYRAADIQREANPDLAWAAVRSGELPLRWDESTLRDAAPGWRQCVYHSRQRDKYLHASSRPWLILHADPPPGTNGIPATISQEAFQEEFVPFIESNQYFLNVPMAFETERDARILELNQRLLSQDQIDKLAGPQ